MKMKKVLALGLTTVLTLNLVMSSVGTLDFGDWQLPDWVQQWDMEVEAEESTDTDNENQNIMTSDEYASFNFTDTLGDIGVMLEDVEDPLSGYEAIVPLELYVGTMNKDEEYVGEFTVIEDAVEESASGLSISDREDDSSTTVGSTTSYNDAASIDKIEIQTKNACAWDWDGDGIDEIVETTLYVDKTFTSKPKKRSMQYITVWSLNSVGEYEEIVAHYEIELVDSDSNDDTFIWSLDADSSKGYAELTTGDYDRDGIDELAVYVPSTVDEKPYVLIMEVKATSEGDYKYALEEKQKIELEELDDSNYSMAYKDEYLPMVDLYTTQISGEDDLVISASFPRISNNGYQDYTQLTAVGIYRWNGDADTAGTELEQKVVFQPNGYETWDEDEDTGDKFRFSSAVDADLNGNGVEELVLGGYMNNDLDDNKGVGEISSVYNLIHLVCWGDDGSGNTTYNLVWENAQRVSALIGEGLYVDNIIMEPAALTSGIYLDGQESSSIFLEGVVFNYEGTAEIDEGEYEGNAYVEGDFVQIYKIDLTDNNNGFISTAETGVFALTSDIAEQTVILVGDHASEKNAESNVYYDIMWLWGEDDGLTSAYSDNNYIDNKGLSQGGTFMCIAPLNADSDSVYVEYTGCEYEWSTPAVNAVLECAPYWSEIQYADDEGTRGSTSWSITTEHGNEDESETSLTEELGAELEILFGKENKHLPDIMLGFDAEFGGMWEQIEGYAESVATSESYEIEANAISGEDVVVLSVVPIVYHHYDVYMPEHVVTAEDLADYYDTLSGFSEDELKALGISKIEYKAGVSVTTWNVDSTETEFDTLSLGDVLDASEYEMVVTSSLNCTYTHMALEEYNEAVEDYNLEHENEEGFVALEVIKEEALPSKEVGDPSTYNDYDDKTISGLSDVALSGHSITTGNAESDTTISMADIAEEETTKGSATGYGGGGAAAFDYDGKCIDISAELGFTVDREDTTITRVSSSTEIEASVTYGDIPEASDYNFTVYMMTGTVDLGTETDTGDDIADGPLYVGSYVVLPDSESAPPMLPTDVMVASQTETYAVIEWENPDEESARLADYYVLHYLEGYNEATGAYTKASPCTIITSSGIQTDGVVDSSETSCMVLTENKDGAYAFIAYENDTTVIGEVTTNATESVLGEAIVITAKNGNEAPTIETQPTDAEIVTNEEGEEGEEVEEVEKTATFTVTAQPGNVSNPGDLTFTLQQYEHSATSTIGVWEDCKDVTITVSQVENSSAETATITLKGAEAGENYRCLVTETSAGSSITYTTASNVVTCYEEGTTPDTVDVEMTVSIEDVSVKDETTSEIEWLVMTYGGETYMKLDQDFTVDVTVSGTDVSAGDYIAVYANGQKSSEVLLGYITVVSGITSYELAVDVDKLVIDAVADPDIYMSTQSDTYSIGAIYLNDITATDVGIKSSSSIRVNIGQLDQSTNYYQLNYSVSYDEGSEETTSAFVNVDNPNFMTSYTSDFALAEPSIKGYDFVDWSLDSEKYIESFNTKTNTIMPSLLPIDTNPETVSDYNLTAKFTLHDYKVTYVLNETGNEELADIVADADTNAQLQDMLTNDVTNTENPSTYNVLNQTITLAEPVCAGLVFMGWYTDPEFSEDSKVTSLQGSDCTDVTLYAKWRVEVYSVIYYLYSGMNAEENPFLYTAFSKMIEFGDAGLIQNYFRGWYDSGAYDEVKQAIEDDELGDLVVHALWEFITPEPDLDEVNGVYQISSLEDLQTLAEFVNQYNVLFTAIDCELTCNIDGGGADWELPIGTTTKPFYGNFNGNNYIIYNLNLTSDEIQGVFGSVAKAGSVSNLRTLELTTNGDAVIAGGIAGENYGTIDNCYSGAYQPTLDEIESLTEVDIDNSSIKATMIAGGVVGMNHGTITNSASTAYVESVVIAGGIAGVNEGTIENGYNVGTIMVLDPDKVRDDLLLELEDYVELDHDDSDDESVVDESVTIEAFSDGLVGGIVGLNLDEGSMFNLYNAGVIDLLCTHGGVVGLSETDAFEYCYYRESVLGETVNPECANQDSATTISKTSTEMQGNNFAETLSNNTIGTGLSDWNRAYVRNGGFPVMEIKDLEYKTVTTTSSSSSSTGGGSKVVFSITGDMHENSVLYIRSLLESDEGYSVLTKAAGDAEIIWMKDIGLKYSDGTICIYDGNLVLRFSVPDVEDTSDLVLLHYAEDGTVVEHFNETTDAGYFETTLTSFSPFALVNTATGETAVEDVNTGDDTSVWMWIVLMTVTVIGLGGVMYYKRRRKK